VVRLHIFHPPSNKATHLPFLLTWHAKSLMLLVVKYDTPSNEFTFCVGIDSISKLMILTPLT
jgi:hypothetical protein